MAKKDNTRKYIPTNTDIENYKYCISMDIAFSLKRISNEQDSYYIQKYKPSKYNLISNLRINKSLPDIPSNRVALNEYEGLKKIFELYSIERKIKEKTMVYIEEKKEEVVVKEIKKNKNKELDLFDLIENATKENANEAKQK